MVLKKNSSIHFPGNILLILVTHLQIHNFPLKYTTISMPFFFLPIYTFVFLLKTNARHNV